MLTTSVCVVTLPVALPTFRFTLEFAFEIGNGLLTEIRRLSSLLGERDKAIQDMKEEKGDHGRIVESLKTTIRQNDKMIGLCLDQLSRIYFSHTPCVLP